MDSYHMSASGLKRNSSVSSWSGNLFSLARHRINSLASSLATSVEHQHSTKLSCHGRNHHHHHHRSSQSINFHRRGSWSPEQYSQRRRNKHSNNIEHEGSYIYSIFDDQSMVSMSTPPPAPFNTSVSHYRVSSNESLSPNCSPTETSFASKQPIILTTSFDVVSATHTSQHRLGKLCPGSLESVNFDEYHELSSSTQSDSSRSFHSSSPLDGGMMFDVRTPSPTSSPSSLEDYDSPLYFVHHHPKYVCQQDDSFDQLFATKMSYPLLTEIQCHYDHTHKLHSKDSLVSSSSTSSEISISVSDSTRSISSFDGDFKIQNKLSGRGFQGEGLQKPFITWDLIHLLSEVELARWEYSSMSNLYRRFQVVPFLGKPVDWICPDPNSYLRNLCTQLLNSGNDQSQFIRSLKSTETNKTLKRWNSCDDLNALVHLIRSQSNCPEFDNAVLFDRKSTPSRSNTDDCIALWDLNEDTFECSLRPFTNSSKTRTKSSPKKQKHKCKNLSSNKFNGSSASFNKIISLLCPLTLSTKADYQASVSGKIDFNCLLFREMISLINSSPTHLAIYVTKFHLEQYRKGLSLDFLISLVLFKNVPNLSRPHSEHTFSQTLFKMLKFDDTLVAVVREYMRRQNTIIAQAKCLENLIETACLLRQLRNFHGFKVLLGAMQSLHSYSMNKAWIYLSLYRPHHFCDFQKLSKLNLRLSDQCMLGTSQNSYIPTLSSMVNKLRINVLSTWDLLDVKRRFVEHPSLAAWINTITSNIIPEQAEFSTVSISNVVPTTLSFDSAKETYLSKCEPIRLSYLSDFPSNITKRNISAIPDCHLRYLLALLPEFVRFEINNSYRLYDLPTKFY